MRSGYVCSLCFCERRRRTKSSKRRTIADRLALPSELINDSRFGALSSSATLENAIGDRFGGDRSDTQGIARASLRAEESQYMNHNLEEFLKYLREKVAVNDADYLQMSDMFLHLYHRQRGV